jgi:hypothetical protein
MRFFVRKSVDTSISSEEKGKAMKIWPAEKQADYVFTLLPTPGGVDHSARDCPCGCQQLLLSSRQNLLPVKCINWALLMGHKHAARALVELMQIGKTPSGPNPLFHHAPKAFKRIEMVATPGRQAIPAQLLVPVGQR